MARSLYVPVHLHARLVTPNDPGSPVPTLADAPCSAPAAPRLANGVHLHWSLPDVLTRAAIPKDGSRIGFPAVPDRWLVIRFFNPPGPTDDPGDPPPPRRCVTFVVDAKGRRSGRLGELSFETDPRWLTVMGLLPDGVKTSDGGPLPADVHLEAAYYPSARDRFGFHDDLADLLGDPFAKKKPIPDTAVWSGLRLSYLVIGSYRSAAEDPLARAGDEAARRAWIDAGRLYVDLPEPLHVTRIHCHANLLSGARKIDPKTISYLGPNPDGADQKSMGQVGSIDVLGKLGLQGSPALVELRHEIAARLTRDAETVAHLHSAGLAATAALGVLREDADGVPSRLVCHGAVVDVGPNGAFNRSGPDPLRTVAVAASASAAIEEAFVGVGGGEVFALLRGGLEGETEGAAGMQALPHLLHAAGFDGAPDLQPGPDGEVHVVEFVATVQDGGTVPADPAVPAGAVVRVVDRRTKAGPPVAAELPASGLGGLRNDVKPAVVVVERRVSPRPRWYRPSTPVLVFGGHGRSFRHGHDGRMRLDGRLLCRAGGQTVRAVTLAVRDGASSHATVAGRNLVDLDPALRFEPDFVRALIFETALLDPGNAPRVGGLWMTGADPSDLDLLTRASDAFVGVATTWWVTADPAATPPADSADFKGTLPAALAITPWRAAFLALHAEVDYVFHPRCTASLAGVTFGPLDLEISAAQAAASVSACTRQVLSSALPATLQSAITRVEQHFGKVPERAAQLADIVTRLRNLDVLTAGLAELDPALRAAELALRGGTLAVRKLRLVDTFGQIREVEPPTAELPPRLTHWGRVQARLIADDSGDAAGPRRSPVCGYLLFDPAEQAIEVFDRDGGSLGQLRHDRYTGVDAWEAAPSRTGVALADIGPAVPRTIASELLAPGTANTASALVDAIRVLDTARFAVARRLTGDDHRSLLIRRPVLIVRAALTFEVRRADAHDMPALPPGAPPPTPDRLQVRLGSLDQIDDALLGYFARDDEGRWRMHVVPDVAGKAWTTGVRPHPLIDTSAILELRPGAPREVYLLLDGPGAFHVQAGLLPRKRIDTSEVVPARALARLLPTLRVESVLHDPAHPRVAAPPLSGTTWTFVEQRPTGFVDVALGPFGPALAELPERRATIREGWLRLDPLEE